MISITKRIRDELLAHAKRGSLHEVCGILAGTMDGEVRKVDRIYECTNVDPYPDVGYEIDPMELLKVNGDVEAAGLGIVGFYHSHPMSLAKPSMIDEVKATWSGHSYIIVSPKSSDQITSWIWRDESGFTQEEVVVK